MKDRYKLLKLVALTIFTLLIILPFIWMILLSFKTNNEIYGNLMSLPKSFSLENYTRALDTLDLPLMYKNTLINVVVSVSIEVVITFMSSYAIARLDFKNKKIQKLMYNFLLIGLVVPAFILLFPVYRITILLDLYGKRLALIIPYIATSISFNSLLFIGFLREFPKELEEAAIIDGCKMWQIWWKVIMPIMKPVFATVVVFNIIYVWNEFPFATTLISNEALNTISLGTSMFKGQFSVDYAGMIAGSLLILLPQLVIYGFFQRYIIEGLTAGAVKG